MPKPNLWNAIRDALAQDLASDAYASGQKLPSEAALSQRFGVNRHTLRRALHSLVEEGLLTSRRGAGFFVATAPARYELGQTPQFTRDVQQSGRFAEKRTDRLEIRQATLIESTMLQGARQVLVFEGVGLVDARPIAWFSSRFDADRFPELSNLLAEKPSVSRAWNLLEIPVHRTRTDISACAADSLMAQRLDTRPGSALLKTVAIDSDDRDLPIEFGESWYVGERLTLSVST